MSPLAEDRYSHAKVIDYINISKFGMNKVRKLAMKFSYLILSKIVKIVATRGQILRQKCAKIRFCWGSLHCSPSPPSWILGALHNYSVKELFWKE